MEVTDQIVRLCGLSLIFANCPSIFSSHGPKAKGYPCKGSNSSKVFRILVNKGAFKGKEFAPAQILSFNTLFPKSLCWQASKQTVRRVISLKKKLRRPYCHQQRNCTFENRTRKLYVQQCQVQARRHFSVWASGPAYRDGLPGTTQERSQLLKTVPDLDICQRSE